MVVVMHKIAAAVVLFNSTTASIGVVNFVNSSMISIFVRGDVLVHSSLEVACCCWCRCIEYFRTGGLGGES